MADIWGPIIGAAVGAAAVLASQYFTNRQQGRLQGQRIAADKVLKEMDFERLNRGVYNQVMALVSEVGKFVYQCRTVGPVDFAKMDRPLGRMLDRVYMADVTNALTPSQTTALYDAAGWIEIAYLNTLREPWGGHSGKTYDYDMAARMVRATFKGPCESLAFFWHEMGDEIQARKYKAAADAQDS